MHAATTNNDLPVAALFLFAAALILNLRTSRDTARLAILTIMALGLAFGTKACIAFLSPGLLVLSLWAWRQRQAVPRHCASGRISTGVLVSALASATLLGGFWYVRDLVEFGNPFYPAGLSLFGQTIFEPESTAWQQGTFSLGGLVENLVNLATVKIFDLSGPYVPDLNNMTGWGWFAFGCGIPAMFYALATRGDFRWLAFGFVTALLSLLSWVAPDAYNMRFALWLPLLAAVAFGFVLQDISFSAVRAGLAIIGAGALGLNAIGTLSTALLPPKAWRAMVAVPVAERSAAGLFAARRQHGEVYLDVLRHVPPGSLLAYNVRPNDPIYPLYGADFSRRLHYLQLTPDASIAAAMGKTGVRYLFVFRAPDWLRDRLAAEVDQGLLHQTSGGLYVVAH
jgi:hypothetical protein